MGKPTDDLTEFQIIWCVGLALVIGVAVWAYLSQH
jgi:hypothetical protein